MPGCSIRNSLGEHSGSHAAGRYSVHWDSQWQLSMQGPKIPCDCDRRCHTCKAAAVCWCRLCVSGCCASRRTAVDLLLPAVRHFLSSPQVHGIPSSRPEADARVRTRGKTLATQPFGRRTDIIEQGNLRKWKTVRRHYAHQGGLTVLRRGAHAGCPRSLRLRLGSAELWGPCRARYHARTPRPGSDCLQTAPGSEYAALISEGYHLIAIRLF